MQSAVEKERSRIAKDIHDDLGASLTQVTLLSELGQSAAGQPEAAGQTFGKIADKARLAVQALDEIVWAVNPRNDNLPPLVRYICRHADECFDSSSIRCWQKVPDDLPNLLVRAEVRHNLFLAVKEALHNVLKHSQATEVWLQLQLQDHALHLEIKDNGCGFAVSQADLTRSGLKNMRTRLAEIQGTMELDSQPNRGTQVRFSVKLPPTPEPLPRDGISMP
jgi:signal transduction histidine kinase